MKVIYISGGAPDEIISYFAEKYAKSKSNYVQQRWDYLFLSSLGRLLNENFFAISYAPVSTFPASKCVISPTKIHKNEKGTKIVFPRAWNIPVIKQISQVHSVKKELAKLCKAFKGERIIILTHCVYLQSAKAAFWAREKFGVEVYTMVPDLPKHAMPLAFNHNPILRKMFSSYIKRTTKMSPCFDGYVCFSEPQMEHLNKEKPHIVMEGFFDFSIFDEVECKENNPNRVVYAGSLMYRYGIRELVDGFIKAEIPGTELFVYGSGEAEEYAKNKEHLGVKYGGSLSRLEMIAIEKSSFLLVNPRPTDDEYSRCSFPSKLMEYMASGTPTLTTRLGCIRAEYEDKMAYIETVSSDGIAAAIKRCFGEREAMIKMGKRAEKYIREEKNVDIQAKRVIDFLLENK